MEQLRALEEICRDLVFVQIKIAGLKKIWEQKLPPEPSAQAAPAAGEAAFAAGPPQVLKIALPLYPPRFQVHPGPLYSLNRAEPSTYQQVRKLWFAHIQETLQKNAEKLSGLQTFSRTLVWISVFFPDARTRDIDNFTVKLINDALVALKILEDDDHSRLSVILKGCTDREKPRTEIFVVEDQGQLAKIQPTLY